MEKKIKFGCVAWGLPGGGYFDHRLQRKLDWMEFNLNLEVMNGVIR